MVIPVPSVASTASPLHDAMHDAMHDELHFALQARARRVRLMLTDCDGVLTDGGVYVSEHGEAMKRFSLRDGMGVERLRELCGIPTGIVTREQSPIVSQRAHKLRLDEVHLGVRDKREAVQAIADRRGLTLDEIAYIGDDVNDLDVLTMVGFAGAPSDAEPSVLDVAHFISSRPGGHGAFREFAECIVATYLSTAATRP
jgi:3-deoxy-D-manno-octulosonate 8-phosphate phosphatase (KDO 8-P phosphatase)